MEGLINRISDRITAGAQEEILELTKIPYIGIHRARALYTGGITTPKAIVTLGSVDKIAAVLKQYNKNSMAPSAIVRAAREILARAREIVAEQTREEREEAETRLAEIREIEAGMANENSLDLAIEPRCANGSRHNLARNLGRYRDVLEHMAGFLGIFRDFPAEKRSRVVGRASSVRGADAHRCGVEFARCVHRQAFVRQARAEECDQKSRDSRHPYRACARDSIGKKAQESLRSTCSHSSATLSTRERARTPPVSSVSHSRAWTCVSPRGFFVQVRMKSKQAHTMR